MHRFLQRTDLPKKSLEPLSAIIKAAEKRLHEATGDGARFKEALSRLPQAIPSVVDLSSDTVTIGAATDLPKEERTAFYTVLREFLPWRKGPFSLFGVDVDTEWNSYLKWNRILPHISPLKGRRILDIGCSNGYYLFRALAQEPELALGIDPYLCFYYQYLVIQSYLKAENLYYIPVVVEDTPPIHRFFDTVFLMGILYHQPSPVEVLKKIKPVIRRGGELVLETLVIPGEEHVALFPAHRYQKMRNVYFLPTIPTLTHFMERAGYKNIRTVDVCATDTKEQRKTDWVFSESLSDFLDPKNSQLTVEGYPAPVRATVVGEVHY